MDDMEKFMNADTHRRVRRRRAETAIFALMLLLLVVPFAATCIAEAGDGTTEAATYYPGKWDDWEARAPQDVGMDAALLDKAVAYSKAHETTRPKNLDLAIRQSISGQTYDELIGPTKPRGSTSGMVLRHGYIVAEWGNTRRVDMTFSATKSYLATTVGLAWDKGLIRKLDDPARMQVPGKTFASKHNRAITWHIPNRHAASF